MIAYFDDVILDGNYLWTVCKNVNMLVKVDIATGKLVRTVLLEGGTMLGGHCYCHNKKISDMIIFIPTHDEPILILHLQSERIEYIGRDSCPEMVYSAFIYCNELYMMTVKDKDFSVLNLDRKDIKRTHLQEKIQKNSIFWHHRCFVEGRNAYLCIYDQNCLAKVDLIDETITYMHYFDDSITDFIYFSGSLWFALNNGEIAILDLNECSENTIQLNTERKFFFVYRDVLYVLQEDSWKLDKVVFANNHVSLDGEVEEELKTVIQKMRDKDSGKVSIEVNNVNEIFFQNRQGSFLKISNDRYFYSEGLEMDLTEYGNRLQRRDSCCYEMKYLGIREMIELTGVIKYEEGQQKQSKCVGEVIYNHR